jgi:NADH dehydrogenase
MTVIPSDRLVTIFGGSGFVGRHIVRALASEGWRIRVAVRHPNMANFLKPIGRVGQIQIVKADIEKEDQVADAVRGADTVVNLIGTFKRFNQLHVDAAGRIARLTKKAGASRFVHFSVIGASKNSPARYYRSKAEGEIKVREIFPAATIIRPSIIFGQDDSFFNRFAALIRLIPIFFPLFGSGTTRFQPVFVGDIAVGTRAILNSLQTQGQTFEFAGPEIMTFRQVIEFVLKKIERTRILIPVPMALTKLNGAILQYFPCAALTLDQARMLETDNIMSGTLPGLRDLGINPTAADAIATSYLWRFRKRGQFKAASQ